MHDTHAEAVEFFHSVDRRTADTFETLFEAAVSSGATAHEARIAALYETARHVSGCLRFDLEAPRAVA